MLLEEILREFKSLSDPKSVEGMARFGITPSKTFGIRIPVLRKIAKKIKKDRELAHELWRLGFRETMILASMIDDPKQVTEEQMNSWVKDFDYWEICDQTIMNLFEKTEFAYKKAFEWSSSDEEFIKRAGYVMIARLAVSDKEAENKSFTQFFPIIAKGATDSREMVKKGVNWALRQIGKRNLNLNKEAIKVAKSIFQQDSNDAKWVAKDAIKELESESIQKRLN
ncbi:MAG: DNA alkylation repair protein [Candidatus Heimdallarchaeota archaeon]|nr:DNA alkylation repair protein [Candidatus Heimdallarchaeota archaeon]